MNDTNNNLILKIQLAKELEKAVRYQRLNQELYNHLISVIMFLMKAAEKLNITLPNLDKIHDSISRIHSIMDDVDDILPSSSPIFEHPNKIPEDGTEP